MARKKKPRRRTKTARGAKSKPTSNNGSGPKGQTQVRVEVTLFISEVSPLSKHIHLAADGSLVSDSSARLVCGTAERRHLTGLDDLAALFKGCTSHNAFAL